MFAQGVELHAVTCGFARLPCVQCCWMSPANAIAPRIKVGCRLHDRRELRTALRRRWLPRSRLLQAQNASNPAGRACVDSRRGAAGSQQSTAASKSADATAAQQQVQLLLARVAHAQLHAR